MTSGVIEITMAARGEPGTATAEDLDALAAELLEHEGTNHHPSPRWPEYTPMNVGHKYNGNGRTGGAIRTTGTVLNQLVVGGLLWSGDAGCTMDLFDLYVTTIAAAGGIYRAGVWIVDDQERPFEWTINEKYATLVAEVLQEGASFDTTVGGLRSLTPDAAIVVPPDLWFVVGGVAQVALCQPTIGNSSARFSPLGQSNVGSGVNSADAWLVCTGVDGPLGDFTPNSALLNIGHGVGFRRSA